MRFHLLDRVEEVCEWKYITAVKCISLADDVFDEHFPGYPIFPGSLILEGLAQLGGSFFEMAIAKRGSSVRRAVLSIVREFKIKKPTGPGDRLLYRADVVSMKQDFGVVKVVATLDGSVCATGELMFTFVDLPNERITQSRQELYAIVTRQAIFVDHEDPV